MTELVRYELKAEPKQPDLSELHPLERGRERECYTDLPEGAKFVYTSTTSRLNLESSDSAIGSRCSIKNVFRQVRIVLRHFRIKRLHRECKFCARLVSGSDALSRKCCATIFETAVTQGNTK